jgi:hypothetical protein
MKKINFWLLFFVSITLSAQNESKLVIDAGSGQTNTNPLIRLRNSSAADLLWIHSDHISNAFLGVYAGVNNSGFNNAFIGASAGAFNQGASFNTGLGASALYANTSGVENTAVGFYALYQSASGGYNTAIGSQALYATNGASYNTAVGSHAGTTWNNGWNNVFVGANTDVSTAGLFNVVAVGQGTGVAASSTARFGNSATGSYGGWANWTNVSDGRFKKNIQNNVPGLEFILRLEPVTYNLDVSGISKALHENQGKEWGTSMKEAIAIKEAKVQTGFIAQEVEKIAKEIGFDFSGVDAPKNEHDLYGLRYAEFVVPLVKAVQELNEELKLQVKTLGAENEILAQRLESIEALLGLQESAITQVDLSTSVNIKQ